jgi:hypothetical protein
MKLKLTEIRCNDDECPERHDCERYLQRLMGCKVSTMYPEKWRSPGDRCPNKITREAGDGN